VKDQPIPQAQRILLVSHMSTPGGAQNGLLHLIDLLQVQGHQCSVLCPAAEGGFVQQCNKRGLECLYFPFAWSLPVPSNGLLDLMRPELESALEGLRRRDFDLVVSNTTVIFFGAEVAHRLCLPHIVYAHELLTGDPQLRPRGCTLPLYLQMLDQRSCGWLACSDAVKQMLQTQGGIAAEKVLTLQPRGFNLHQAMVGWSQGPVAPWRLVLIGELSMRKDPAFAVLVLHGLRRRGHQVVLEHYGTAGNAQARFEAMVSRLGLAQFVQLHGWCSEPAAVLDHRSIHLITARSEPFGLTIPECLERGVPVVASRSGGPQELLPKTWLYPVDDLEACVNAIEAILLNPSKAAELMRMQRSKLADRLDRDRQRSVLMRWWPVETEAQQSDLESAHNPVAKSLWALVQNWLLQHLNQQKLGDIVRRHSSLNESDWLAWLKAEQQRPGTAVEMEMASRQLVPHAMSSGLDELYRDGNGFLIELLAGFGKGGRLEMSLFALVTLLCRLDPKQSRVLLFGDGLGFDTAQLLSAGFAVDYLDVEQSRVSTAARTLIANWVGPSAQDRLQWVDELGKPPIYDAIISFEVIEHIHKPRQVLNDLARVLKPDGLLIMSECFAGVEPQWPTHLHENLRYAGLLPFLLAEQGFSWIDSNSQPGDKPMVFRRCRSDEWPAWHWLQTPEDAFDCVKS